MAYSSTYKPTQVYKFRVFIVLSYYAILFSSYFTKKRMGSLKQPGIEVVKCFVSNDTLFKQTYRLRVGLPISNVQVTDMIQCEQECIERVSY